MSRKVNLKAVAILIVSLAVIAGASYLVRGYQIRRNAKSLLVQADRAKDADDKPKQLQYLRAYLGLAPNDHEVRLRYALLFHELARTTSQREFAYYLFEGVLRHDPDNTEVRRKATQIASSLGRVNDAQFHLDFLNKKAEGKDAEVLEAMGAAESARRDWKKAADWYAEATKVDPKRISSWAARASLLRKHLDQPKEAEDAINQMLAANPGNPDAEIARIRFFRESNKSAEEKAVLRKSLDQWIERHADTHPELLLQAASLDAESGATQSARVLLQKGLKLHPDEMAFTRELARLELRAGNSAEAVKLLRSVADKLPPRTSEYRLTIELLLEAGDKEEATKLIRAIGRDEDTAGLIGYLEARLAVAEENWAESARLLEHARLDRRLSPELVKNANLLLARCHQKLGNPDRQLEAAQASLQSDPLWLPGLVARAEALVATGKPDEALTVYGTIKNQAPATRLTAARLLVARTLALPPDQRDWKQPLALLDGAPPEVRDGAEAIALRGRILTARGARGDRPAAVKALEAGLEKHPKDATLWLALAEAVDEDNKGEAVGAVLDRAEKAMGDGIELRLARAELTARQGDEESAKRQLNSAEKAAESREGPERERWLLSVGNFRLATGDLAGAEKTYARLGELMPNSLSVWAMRLEIAAISAQPDQLRPIIDKLEKLEGPDGTRWRYGKALLHALEGKPTEARVLLAEVRKRRPNWSRPYSLEGRISESEGNWEKAILNYRAALDRGEATPGLIARLAPLLHQQRNYTEAAAVLARLRGSNSGLLGRLATVTELLTGETNPEALVEASKKLPADSKDPLDHVLRGRLLRVAQKPKEAEAAFRRAVELAPRQPETHLALVTFLADVFPEKMAEAIQRAEKDLPEASAPLVLGICYELAGDRDKADARFRAALAAAPTDSAVLRTVALTHLRRGQLATAKPLFLRLIKQESSDPVSAAYARRTLALALAATGDYASYKEAIDLVSQKARGGELSAEDQRALALIMARQPRDRRETIRTLEASFARITPTPEEEFFLAVLLVAEREWARANERLLGLLTSRNGANPSFILYYVAQLILHDELNKAEHWVERLEKIEPGSLRAVGGRARLLQAQKKSKEARELLRVDAARYAKDLELQKKEPTRQLGLARLMDSLGFEDDAEKAYRAFASNSKDPLARAPLVQFLGRKNRCREALEECEKIRGKVPDSVLAEVTVSVLRDGEPSDAQCETVIGWLQEARQKSKERAIFDLALANVSDLRGKTAEAIASYRALLQRDENNLLANNNLAVLLALSEGKYDDALASINKALDAGGPLPDLLDTKGLVLLAAGKPAAAVEALAQATQMSPNAGSFFRLACAQLEAGNRREAGEAWARAKAEGFTLNLLHPLERPKARKALVELEEKK